MKKHHNHNPAGHSHAILKQLCQLIPGHLVASLAKEHGVDAQSRTFTPWSHVVSLLFAQRRGQFHIIIIDGAKQ